MNITEEVQRYDAAAEYPSAENDGAFGGIAFVGRADGKDLRLPGGGGDESSAGRAAFSGFVRSA